ncbi:plasmid pRiA4b ORF-3 family protein [Fodinisporobacter ferrooxydans]|uniref:Plasmid pRiA4b ORF-3 family protein n=1 Tax=Fodinisporobacter ferrooxydans TaxID=2901836 RepID=A0ABY4CIY0_9BACL|nr:plasmid pRiA4b ORF-3 family protein [Alicyclobacillaceae bacterium MYW30-H2]
MIYQFKVALEDIHPSIWRRFQVDSSITFHQLHKTLQIVMGWQEYHLYEFNFGSFSITRPDPTFPPDDRSELHARREKLHAHLINEGQQVVYIYDFGDDWKHELILEKILPKQDEMQYPFCLEGQRSCPPEDCGGTWEYQRMVEILATKSHPEYKDTVSMLKKGFDPEGFDLEEVNVQLHKKASQLNQKANSNVLQHEETPKKPVKLTAAKLKKQLQSLSNTELIQIVVETFKSSKQAEQFLTVKLVGEEAVEGLFAVYQKKIKDEFFPDRGFGKLRLAEAKKAIDEFEKITQSKKHTLELKLFYVVMGVDFMNAYGDIDARFYENILKMYESVIEVINEDDGYDLYEEYEERIAAIVDKTDGIGWGFHDAMQDIHEAIRWL